MAGGSLLTRSIIAANRSGGNCSMGSFVADPRTGGSVDDDGTCRLDDPTDRSDVPDAGLLPLLAFGVTAAHELTADSPALDLGMPPCGSNQTPLATDQRGAPRPIGLGCDSGAIERQANAG